MAPFDENVIADTADATQPRAFAATDLVACRACSRTNPPTRANCLYCGSALGITPEPVSSIPRLEPQPEAENIVHVVAQSTEPDGQPTASAEMARLVQLTPSELNGLLSGSVTPLYAAKASSQAEAISQQFRTAGIKTVTIPEEQLKLQTPPKDIAGLKIGDDALTAFVRRTSEKVVTTWEDIRLIVTGRLYFTTIEIEQTRNRKKQVLNERQLTTDEAVLDLYSRADPTGWRIRAGSFDFSCLADEKKVTAFENFRALISLLRRKASNALVDDHFVQMRVALDKIWQPQPRESTTERRRNAIRDVNATATVSDNELQFARYSRLVRLFNASELQDDARQG